MIDLNTLRYFTSAFETGTFSHAARVNGVSQPTVSAAIQKLEERLGMPLFKRSKAGLKALPLAGRLYHDVIDSVTHLALLETRLRADAVQTIRIYCAPDMLMHRLAPGLNSLRRRFANLQITFTDDLGACDLAYISQRCAPDTHAFIPIEAEPYYVAVARFDPLAALQAVRIQDLRGYPFIERPYCPNADRLELAISEIAFTAQATNDYQLLELISAGLGAAFVPESHAYGRDDIALLSLVGVETGLRRIGVSHKRSARATELAKLLANGGEQIQAQLANPAKRSA